jgi:hypothetical protein
MAIVSLKTRVRSVDEPMVTISPKKRRAVFNTKAVDELSGDGSVEFVKILVDDEVNGVFWVKPCFVSDEDSRRMDFPSKRTRSVGISGLITGFKLKDFDSFKVKSVWDDAVNALFVDTRGLVPSIKTDSVSSVEVDSVPIKRKPGRPKASEVLPAGHTRF